MPRKVNSVMDERLRFSARVLEGETVSDVCRGFAILRETGFRLRCDCEIWAYSNGRPAVPLR